MSWGRPYTVKVTPVRSSGFVQKQEYINGFTAVNKGDEIAIVNGFPIDPPTALTTGEAIEFGGNYGEVFDDSITVQFLGGGVNPLVYVVQKVYKTCDIPTR